MKNTTASSFSQTFATFEDEIRLCDKEAVQAKKTFRLAKLHAYNAATQFVEMTRFHVNELQDLIRSEIGQKSNMIDLWLDKRFAHLKSWGEDWRELIAAVAEGKMTRDQYLESAAIVFLNGKRQSRSVESGIEPPPLPAKPDESVPMEERLARLESRCLAAEQAMRTYRERWQAAEREAAGVRKENESLRRQMKRMHKLMQDVPVGA